MGSGISTNLMATSLRHDLYDVDHSYRQSPTNSTADDVEAGYQGQYNTETGDREGTGVYTYSDGSIYEGEWKCNKKHGHGTFTFANGDQYIGEFHNNKMQGEGVFTYASSSEVYMGEWKEGFKEGFGTQRYLDGRVYSGQWRRGIAHGRGTMRYVNKNRYCGEWREGVMEGEGTFTYHTSGEAHAGRWRHGFAIHASITDTLELAEGDATSLRVGVVDKEIIEP